MNWIASPEVRARPEKSARILAVPAAEEAVSKTPALVMVLDDVDVMVPTQRLMFSFGWDAVRVPATSSVSVKREVEARVKDPSPTPYLAK